MNMELVDRYGNPLKVTKKGALQIFKRIPDYATLVNEGKVWNVLDQTTTAALVAIPTTVAGLTLQNPASSGKWYIVWALSAYMDAVPATLSTVSVFHCAHKLAVAALTRDITLQATGAGAVCGLRAGQGAYSGVAVLDRSATVVDDGWTPTPLQLVGNIATTDFNGKEAALVTPVVIPPSFHYSTQCVATVITNQVGLGFVWGELDEEEVLYVA